MIYPMMMKVDFQSIKNVRNNPLGLWVAVAIALFWPTSPVVLVCTIGVLTEVPVMLLLVRFVNKTKRWFPQK
jgi:ACR3 family arsenite efflux pump ArsB